LKGSATRQQLIENSGGAQSKGGTSGNAINGISDTNPNRQAYMDAANSEFGELTPGQKYILEQKELEQVQRENGNAPPPQ